MVIIFNDSNLNRLFICTENDKTKIINPNDPNLLNYVPNDDILYVTDGHLINKAQLTKWITGLSSKKSVSDNLVQNTIENDYQQETNDKYIHPKMNGTIIISDLKTDKFPGGIKMEGKWDFINLKDIGGEEDFDESRIAKLLIKQGKIEKVDQSYYDSNKHKNKKHKSQHMQQLESILIPADMRAKEAVDRGLLYNNDTSNDQIVIDVE